MIRRELELHRLNTGTQSRVAMAVTRLQEHLFRYGGHIGAALIIGGYDIKGPHLVSISPGGNTMDLPYQTVGSGSLAAMAIMETQYHDKMNEQEAFNLVVDSIEAAAHSTHGESGSRRVALMKPRLAFSTCTAENPWASRCRRSVRRATARTPGPSFQRLHRQAVRPLKCSTHPAGV